MAGEASEHVEKTVVEKEEEKDGKIRDPGSGANVKNHHILYFVCSICMFLFTVVVDKC